MKFVLFGATGLTGKEILKQAIDSEHNVIAIVRNPDSMEFEHPNLTIIKGNILDLQSFEEFFIDSDAVISTVGTGTSFAEARKPTTLYSEGFQNIVTAMRKHKLKRFVALLSVGTVPDPNEAAIHRIMIRPILKGTYDDMRRAESFLATCKDIDWTGIRPLRLNNKPRTGKYRTSIDYLPQKGVNISRADVADLMLKLVTSGDTIHKYVTIAD